MKIIAKVKDFYWMKWWNYVLADITRPYWLLRELLFPCKCGYSCGYTYPYGFVPEAGCPIHDA